jgi:hypothetical protein
LLPIKSRRQAIDRENFEDNFEARIWHGQCRLFLERGRQYCLAAGAGQGAVGGEYRRFDIAFTFKPFNISVQNDLNDGNDLNGWNGCYAP